MVEIKICRTCLCVQDQQGLLFTNFDFQLELYGCSVKELLLACVPEMDLNISEGNTICDACLKLLRTSYEFKVKCLTAEEKIYECIQQSGQKVSEAKNLNLSFLILNQNQNDTDLVTPMQTKEEYYFSSDDDEIKPVEFVQVEESLTEQKWCIDNDAIDIKDIFNLDVSNDIVNVGNTYNHDSPLDLSFDAFKGVSNECINNQTINLTGDDCDIEIINIVSSDSDSDIDDISEENNMPVTAESETLISSGNTSSNWRIDNNISVPGDLQLNNAYNNCYFNVNMGTVSENNRTYVESMVSTNENGCNNTNKSNLMQFNFICTICGDTFNKKKKFLKHYYKHRGELPYKCKECTFSTSQKSTLKTHKLIEHYSQQQHTCPVCNKSFPNDYFLLYHMKNHEKQNKNTGTTITSNTNSNLGIFCKQCNKHFLNEYELISHNIEKKCGTSNNPGTSNDPTNESIPKLKIFKCGFCGFSCTVRDQLRLHVKHHQKTITANWLACFGQKNSI